jgi:hypothetical protein
MQGDDAGSLRVKALLKQDTPHYLKIKSASPIAAKHGLPLLCPPPGSRRLDSALLRDLAMSSRHCSQAEDQSGPRA